jgi:MFS family permease
LRGLLALNLAAAAAGAMVIVNTVVYVRTVLGRGADDVALALAAFGGGSMAAALVLPRVLDRVEDRPVMLAAAGLLVAALLALAMQAFSAVLDPWTALLAGWAILGVGYSAVLTPSGRLLRRSANPEDRSALFAAQFALSHACWLVTYLVAGQLGARAGMGWTMVTLAGVATLGVLAALATWPQRDPQTLTHHHPDLPADHPHLAGARDDHAHDYVIDDLHHAWPRG